LSSVSGYGRDLLFVGEKLGQGAFGLKDLLLMSRSDGGVVCNIVRKMGGLCMG
jgi:hypothetical protein